MATGLRLRLQGVEEGCAGLLGSVLFFPSLLPVKCGCAVGSEPAPSDYCMDLPWRIARMEKLSHSYRLLMLAGKGKLA